MDASTAIVSKGSTGAERCRRRGDVGIVTDIGYKLWTARKPNQCRSTSCPHLLLLGSPRTRLQIWMRYNSMRRQMWAQKEGSMLSGFCFPAAQRGTPQSAITDSMTSMVDAACSSFEPANSLDRNAENDLCGTAIRIESKNHRTERPPLLPSRISPLGASWIGARRHERTGHTATYDPIARCYRTCAKNSAVSHADPGVDTSAQEWHKRRWR